MIRPPASSLATTLALATLLSFSAAYAQAPDSSATPDSAVVVARPIVAPRASWLSDRIVLRVGDILTVVVDEQTQANERVSKIATGNRNLRGDINASVSADARVGPEKSIGLGLNNNSRDVGEANRAGDLSSVLSVRVLAIGADGNAQIAGSKKVMVDGRLQEVSLAGSVRPQDVSSNNVVLSNHIVDAMITYKGKKIDPRTGIGGRLLGMLWP